MKRMESTNEGLNPQVNTDQTYEEWKEGMKDKSVGEYRLNMQGRKEELKACARKWKWIKYAEKHNQMQGK